MYWIYPGFCSKCGKRWGDHLTDYALKHTNPYACRFQPKPGEINEPILNNELEK